MLVNTSASLPGIYPVITQFDPLQARKGKDNLGFGETQHGEKFLLKNGGSIGAAEFVGAKVCDACGIPACQPTIVTLELSGRATNLFGSRVESGEHKFDQTMVAEWRRVMSATTNPSAFSALLAVDLVLGNDDRHWNNWFIHDQSANGTSAYRLRAMDFSRSWPTSHPASHPSNHKSPNTWQATKEWPLLGVQFDLPVFYDTCARIGRLSSAWLHKVVLSPVVGVFISDLEASDYSAWWERHLHAQVVDAIFALEHGTRP